MKNKVITTVTVTCPTCDNGEVKASVIESPRKGASRLQTSIFSKSCKCKWEQTEWTKVKMDSIDEWACS